MSDFQPNFSPIFKANQPSQSAYIYADTQFEIIQKYVMDFQASLDNEHDVGVMLTNFGSPVMMEVTHIGFHRPVLMIFKGFVSGRQTTLIQHISQINFLLQSVPKKGPEPIRIKGFTVE